MKFVERFAQPSMLGKFPNGTSDDNRNNLLEAIQILASETGAIIPDDLVIDTIEASRNGTADYSKVIDVMDKAISKIVVGQTMTTDDGSSRSQAQVHYDVRQDIIDADANLICESFTDGPLTWLTQFNFPNAATPILKRKTTPDEDLNDKVERDNKIFSLGYRPTPQYIEENYGEGWEPIQSTNPTNQESDDSSLSEFSESMFPDQKELDEALDSISDDELNAEMTPIIEPILNFAEKNGPEKTLSMMSEIYSEMDFDDIVDNLTQMLFVAETHGRVNASK